MNRLRELPYPEDTAELFARIAERPWSIFLDSGPPGARHGRYSLFSCEPRLTLETRGDNTRIEGSGESSSDSTADPLELLREALGERVAPPVAGLPFGGGAMGYFGYELGHRFETRHPVRPPDLPQADMAIGIYDWAVVADHRQRRCLLVTAGRDPRGAICHQELERLLRAPAGPRQAETASQSLQKARTNTSRTAYGALFRRVQDYISAGDCYQVNLAMRFQAQSQDDPWSLYRKLRTAHPAPHAAFFNAPGSTILSLSPERFLQLRGGRVRTCPIKGTRPRGTTPAQDRQLQQQLRRSPKDRAENLMIVDLLRNDLGKSCIPGSVRAPHLFQHRSYATVHHLVSTVTGTLAPQRDGLELLRGCFPGGSVTGAPKLRAIEIIHELEPHRRNVYCGSIAYLGHSGDMDSSIAIRTLVHSQDTLYYWAGGGIVADSEEQAEYQEALDKAAAFFSLCKPPEPS